MYFPKTLAKRPSKLPIHSTAATKSGQNANKPIPLSVSKSNIPPNKTLESLKDAKKPIQATNPPNPSMKRKLSSSPNQDSRVSRAKLNNSTARPTITNVKRPTSVTSSTKTQSSGASNPDKQSRTIAKPTSIAGRRKPLAANNVKKGTEEKMPAENKQQPPTNAVTDMPKLKKRPAWDTKGRLTDMEQLLPMLQSKVKNSDNTVNSMKDLLEQEHNKSKHLYVLVMVKA